MSSEMKNYDDWKCTPPDCDGTEVDDEEPEPREYRCMICDTKVYFDEECPRCEAMQEPIEWE